ncbi:signal peptidase I [Amycolatopsis suaedae]|uniref:Signal peptidase I n=1 Tax=Amycolatopsis suaedae TaxID=2510978 RepID=A0A4Q7J4S4_9PSEU|nr:signal peptidase I [Amycolatopsis suaedae]RZQ61672.1 signal peptidase I [Amycolatopsis suaedae]
MSGLDVMVDSEEPDLPQKRPRILHWTAYGGVALIVAGVLLVVGGYLHPRISSALSGMGFSNAVIMPDTAAMGPTLLSGDKLLLADVADGDLRRGDVVVLDTAEWDPAVPLSVRRVIGLPGDAVMCCDQANRLVINGVAVEEDYLGTVDPSVSSIAYMPFSAIVPAGRLFVLADGRAAGMDSRMHVGNQHAGTLPVTGVRGRGARVESASGQVRDLPEATPFIRVGLAQPRSAGEGLDEVNGAMVGGFVVGGLGVVTVFGAAAFRVLGGRRASVS